MPVSVGRPTATRPGRPATPRQRPGGDKRHAFAPHLLTVSIALLLWTAPALTLAQDYRPNAALGELLAHTPYV